MTMLFVSVILGKSHYVLFNLVSAMQPRMLVTFDTDLRPLPVSVRVGQVSGQWHRLGLFQQMQQCSEHSSVKSFSTFWQMTNSFYEKYLLGIVVVVFTKTNIQFKFDDSCMHISQSNLAIGTREKKSMKQGMVGQALIPCFVNFFCSHSSMHTVKMLERLLVKECLLCRLQQI